MTTASVTHITAKATAPIRQNRTDLAMTSTNRKAPVAHVGPVNILAPSGKSPYFRLTWTDPNGRPGGTSAGRDLAAAKGKASDIAASLERASGPKGMRILTDIVDEYVQAPDTNRANDDAPWTDGHRAAVARNLRRTLRGYGDRRAMDVDRALLDAMRANAGTPKMVRINTSALRGLLEWGNAAGYFTVEQAQLLPTRCPKVKPALAGTSAPSRRRPGRAVGTSKDYIRPEDAPDKALVTAAGTELQRLAPRWGRLAIEVSCDSGLRWGEQFQLTAYDISPCETGARIEVDWQIDRTAKSKDGHARRTLPKGGKTRVTGVSHTSFTGYPISEELLARREEALREQEAGINPQALMFPTDSGQMFHHSHFMSDYFHPAALAAGWPYVDWTETYDKWDPKTATYQRLTRERRQFTLTWHSNRHRFARTCIDVRRLDTGELMAVGGWESETVVRNRYYRHGKEHTKSALAKF